MINSTQVINQLFEIETKLKEQQLFDNFERNFNRLFSIFEDDGFIIQNPVNEPYTDNRTDCEASIVGELSSKMIISKTLKPIIYKQNNGAVELVQKGIVIVEKNK
jgi:hypothetical protein